MGDERGPLADGGEPLPSVDSVAGLDAYLESMADEKRPASASLGTQEMAERMLAAQLRLARDGAEDPSPAFMAQLERKVQGAILQEQRGRRRGGVSRGGFLRTVASLAGGAGLGVAGVEAASVLQEGPRPPHDLVVAGNDRWYDIAAADEVQPGGIKPFTAGGVLGYLLNDAGRLHAVSAICTHMGCRLKPRPAEGAAADLHCLCHGSRFSRQGAVTHGLAPSVLPSIVVRVEDGRVYAQGTRETV